MGSFLAMDVLTPTKTTEPQTANRPKLEWPPNADHNLGDDLVESCDNLEL